MSIDQQRSFTATLTIPNYQLNFLKVFHGEPVIITETLFGGGHFIGAPQRRDHTNLLSFRRDDQKEKVSPLKLYFRCADDYYVMYVQSPQTYSWNCISMSPSRLLGAYPAAGSKTTSYNILDSKGRIITLDDLRGPQHTIWLKVRNAGRLGDIKFRGSPHLYLGDAGDDDGIFFNLNIIERNVPY